jgi:hypothetical protein
METGYIKAFGNFVVAMAYFDCETKPYRDVKSRMKEGIVALHGSTDLNRFGLTSMLLHNLAVCNFAEISDYNERLEE